MTKINTVKSEITTEQQLLNDMEALRARSEAFASPTRESVLETATAAVDAASAIFREMVIKVRGDNGNLYRIDDATGRPMLPEGTEGMSVELVNDLAYLEEQIASAVVWKLETMLETNAQKQADQRKSLAWARRAADEGRAEEWLVESKAHFLDQLEYQGALLNVAFAGAAAAYEANIGKPFLTRVEREAQKRAAERARLVGTKPTASAPSKAKAFAAS